MKIDRYTDVILTVYECQQIERVTKRSDYPVNNAKLRSALKKVAHGARVSLLDQSSGDTLNLAEGDPSTPRDSVEMFGGESLAFEFDQA